MNDSERDGYVAEIAALKRERDTLRVRLQAQGGLLERYGDIADSEFIGPCAHGRDPYDRCDADDVPAGVTPCGELVGWQAAQRAEREACAALAEEFAELRANRRRLSSVSANASAFRRYDRAASLRSRTIAEAIRNRGTKK